ncbi:hypothetical protein HYV82_05170 [Candidatus Woesearchaeota archaeon]|nr:hypothetical protein [Candidatus Woesearchaeota archaeon]
MMRNGKSKGKESCDEENIRQGNVRVRVLLGTVMHSRHAIQKFIKNLGVAD